MEYFTIELCEILLCLTALSVCVFIVLFIIISTLKKRYKISGIEQKEQAGNFNESVMAQLIKQQLDKSFVDIVDAINDEKLSNNKVVPNKVVPNKVVREKFVLEEISKEPEFVDSDEYDQEYVDSGEYDQNEYDQIESGNSEMIDKPLIDAVYAINDEKLPDNKVVREKFVLEEISKEPEPVDSDEYDQVESNNSEMIDKYDEAAALAKSGMNVCDIADRVKLSMGEIQLIVNLNSLRNESSRAA